MEKPPIIDCHFHIWELQRFRYQFPTAEHGPIYRDFTIKEYGDSMSASPIKHGIFMQVEPEVAVQEAEWIVSQAKDYPFLKGFVAGFKLDDPKLPEILDRYKDEKLFLGVRNILDHHEKDDWLLSNEAVRGMSLLAERGIPYHVLCNVPKHWKYISDMLSKFPNHKFAIDHMGKPIVIDEVRSGWSEWLAEVAKYPNVYCKISGQLYARHGQLTDDEKGGNFTEDQKQYVKRCIELFGVDRCMFGTDWPVSYWHGITSLKDSYDVANGLLAHLTQGERDKIFGLNCVRFYNLDV